MPAVLANAFDEFALSAIQSVASEPLTLAMNALTLLGNPAFWFLIATYFYWKGKKREAFHLVLLMFLAAISTDALKAVFRRARPAAISGSEISRKLAELAGGFTHYSFPSGHAAVTGSVSAYLMGFVGRKKDFALALMAIAVALSRVYLGMHYLSDVIVGLALGVAIGRFVLFERKHSERKKVHFAFLDGWPMIFIIIVTAIAAFLLRTELALYFCLGFFIGFVLLHRSKIETRVEEKWKLAPGLIVLGALGLGAVFSAELFRAFFSFLAGLWISFIFPLLAQQDLKKGLKRLTKKE